MYDFTTITDRNITAASKWIKMYEDNHIPKEGIIPMTVADMEFLPAEEIRQALCNYINHQVLGYSRPTPIYRHTVCNFIKHYHGYEIKPEWIVTTPGVVSALATAVDAFSDPKDGVIIMPPIYPPFYEVVEGQDRVVEECPLQLVDDRYEIDFQRFEKLAKKERTKIFLLCSPHNPGGRVWTVTELRKLANLCLEYGLLMVSDEIHGDIMLTKTKHHILGSVGKDIEEHCIICTSASKTFNIAGLQCSNIIIPKEDLRNQFIHRNLMRGIERANVLGMVATMAAYEEGLDWLEELKQVIKNNVIIVEEFFNKYPHSFHVTKAEAGFLVWVSFESTGYSVEEFMNLLRESEFYVISGKGYGPGGEHFIRINVGLPEKELKQNLNRLEGTLTRHNILD